MTDIHPLRALEEKLQAARFEAVQALASADVVLSSDALKTLATIQTALTAVREEVEAHGARLGWGSEPAED